MTHPPKWARRTGSIMLRVAIAGTTVELIGFWFLVAMIAIGVWAVRTGH
jgi:hypothetical protein